MTSPLINDPLHNPFFNRFHDPVKQRHDELQAQAYTQWLKERNRFLPPKTVRLIDTDGSNVSQQAHRVGRIAGALFLFVLLISAGVLLKVF